MESMSQMTETLFHGETRQDDAHQFVCFKLSSEEYALDIDFVKEVIRVSRVTPIPQMPDFCLGVINIRGNVAALFDLRKLFHLPANEFNSETKILVVNVDDIVISLVVDEILDNIKLASSQIDPTPAVKMRIDRECIRGLGELDKRMIAILDLPKIHDVIKRVIADTGRD